MPKYLMDRKHNIDFKKGYGLVKRYFLTILVVFSLFGGYIGNVLAEETANPKASVTKLGF